MSSLSKICSANIKKEGVNLPVGVLKNISKNSQENTCAVLLFLTKFQGVRLSHY